MADNPITVELPQDLPTNWTYGQTVGPNGADVGLTEQHGYNYLGKQVNAAQQAAKELGNAFPDLASQEELKAHIEDDNNPHKVEAEQIGAIPTTDKGIPNGVAMLDDHGWVISDQMPGYAITIATEAMAQPCQNGPLSMDNIRGNTILGGTPAYDAPVSVESVEGPLKLHISGKNLIDFSKATKTGTASGVSYSISDDGAISLSGVCDRPGNSAYIMPFGSGIAQAFYLPAGSYYLSGLNTDYSASKAVYLYLNCYNGAGETIVEPRPTVYGPAGVGFTLSEGGAWVTVNAAVKDGTDVTGVIITPQIEVGSRATDYEPPSGTTVEIPLLGTDGQELEPLRMAYGGNSSARTAYYDRIVRRNGVWCIERSVAERELTDAVWETRSNYAAPYFAGRGLKDGTVSYLPFCTHFPPRAGAAAGQDTGVWVGNILVVGNQVLPNGAQTTAEELKSFCAAQAEAGTPVTVIYALKNPVYEELHQDVQVLLNTISVPGGTCSVWFEGDILPSADIGLPRGDYPCSGMEGAYRWLAELSSPLPIPTRDDLYAWALEQQRGGVFATSGAVTTQNVPETGNLTGILSVTEQGTAVSMIVFGPTGKIYTAIRSAGVWRGWVGLYSEDNKPRTVRPARFVVGTSAAGWTEADCDYLCDGTADEVEIKAAISALPSGGGEVLLLDGTYNISRSITISKANVVLRGSGPSTVLKRMFNLTSSNGVVACAASNCCIRSMNVDGNKVDYSSDDNRAIYASQSAAYIEIEDVIAKNSHIGIALTSMTGARVSNCIVQTTSSLGFYISNVSSAVLDKNIVSGNGGTGITVENTTDIRLLNTSISNTVDYGITIDAASKRGVISGNTCDQPRDGRSIMIYGSAYLITENLVGDISLGRGSSSNIVAHNILTDSDVVNSGTNNLVESNKVFKEEEATA